MLIIAMARWSSRLAAALLRRKAINFETSGSEGVLARVLNTFDLTTLGIGCTIGSGIYVITGQVALEAGPAVLLSYFIAGFASIFAGLCYAEFGALVPRAGSAYVYSYVTVGEFMAFVIGWNLTLEYIIGTAAVARATSDYIDSICSNVISNWFISTMPMKVSIFSEYPDLLALAIIITLTAILCLGVKESSLVNTIFTMFNLGTILYVIICGAFLADFSNWHIPEGLVPHKNESQTDKAYDHGGFFPYGVTGMLAGAAKCFYAFAGFDVIATTGEEVINPSKSIPISITLTLTICGIGYIATAAILTLIYPYFALDASAPLSMAFYSIGWPVAYYIISVGAICSLATALLTAMFPMPRIIYAMARDGLLWKKLAKVNKKSKMPVRATILSGLLAGIMATFFNVKQLVDMMSIGTLLAYTLVSACVLLLRYEVYSGDPVKSEHDESGRKYPTAKTISLVRGLLIGIILTTICLGLTLDNLSVTGWWYYLVIAIPCVCIVSFIIAIAFQPKNSRVLTFQVPFVPLIPILSAMINIYLMLQLGIQTWVRFAVWLGIGAINYFGYGVRYSKERKVRVESIAPDTDDYGDEVHDINEEDDDEDAENDEEILGSFPGARHSSLVRRSRTSSTVSGASGRFTAPDERTPLIS